MSTSYPLNQIKVVLLESIHERAGEILREAGYDVEHVGGSVTSEAELIERCAGAHMIGIRSKTQLSARFFEQAQRLWAVGCFCIGTNQVDLEAAAARGVAVFNAPFSNTRSVAELTIAEVIALVRGAFARSMQMHAGRWVKTAEGAHEVRGRTLGIVGYGRIGSQVSVLAETMGMRVIYYDVANRLPLGNAQRCETLEELLAQADAVTIHVPAQRDTTRMIGADEIRLMKKSAVLINNARGNVVVVEDLAHALRDGVIAGAAVDVFPEEPSSRESAFESPLRGLDNVILTPHIAGSTEEAQHAIAEEVSGKLIKLMNSGTTSGAVNVPEVELPMLHENDHRVLHFHHNVPGVLSKLHGITAELGVNISAEYLQSDAKRSYVIMDVERGKGEELKRRIASEIEETIRVRTVW